MLYQFSFGLLFFGILVLIAGGIVVVFHQKLADNLGKRRAVVCDRFKFWGLVTCGVGFAIMPVPAHYPIKLATKLPFWRRTIIGAHKIITSLQHCWLFFIISNSTKISDLIKSVYIKALIEGLFSFNNLIVQFINRLIVE
ncbi:hypothetical protein KOY48_00910 [Candidatus Minimicrobia naudis]|uniref:Uncharacterized protein n=1 Tax=Candidatus Minimicrobia naudis TaxID=2841263 RepID=A0A8F1MBN9_9BACT|nr:hypothetical protein KOY48_00910 [Candidatus Minimicrobia naudis]